MNDSKKVVVATGLCSAVTMWFYLAVRRFVIDTSDAPWHEEM